MTENVTKTIERGGALRASTRSLHDLGLDNYPNPEFPEASRLTRKEEKSALQNLNNRLAGNSFYRFSSIDRNHQNRNLRKVIKMYN